jgi:tetratricopeptide (TPR) repeat protein
LLISKAHRQQGDLDKAVAELEGALDAGVKPAQVSLRLARLYLDRGDIDRARQAAQVAVEHDPENATAQFLLGRIAMQRREFEHAETALRTAIRIRPKMRPAHVHLVEVLISAGKLGEATERVQELRRSERLAPFAHKFMGDIHYHEQRFKEAVEEYRAALLHMPDAEKAVAELEEDMLAEPEVNWEELADVYQPSVTSAVKEGARRRDARRSKDNKV